MPVLELKISAGVSNNSSTCFENSWGGMTEKQQVLRISKVGAWVCGWTQLASRAQPASAASRASWYVAGLMRSRRWGKRRGRQAGFNRQQLGAAWQEERRHVAGGTRLVQRRAACAAPRGGLLLQSWPPSCTGPKWTRPRPLRQARGPPIRGPGRPTSAQRARVTVLVGGGWGWLGSEGSLRSYGRSQAEITHARAAGT